MKEGLQIIFNVLFITLTITHNTSGRLSLSTTESEGTAPFIYDGPTDQVAVEGSATAVMKCRVSGVPEPKISWIRNELEIQGGRFEILPTGDLKFNRVSFADSGAYRCKAENKFGTKIVNARLEVKQRTVIVQKPENQEVQFGKNAVFRFSDIHDDSLTVEVEWLKDGSPIDFDNQERLMKLGDNSLMISGTTQLDAGEYTCVVRTQVDEARASAKLSVIGGAADLAKAPIITSVDCYFYYAEVSWKPQGDNVSPILYYTVQSNSTSESGISETREFNVSSSTSLKSVPMKPWSEYSFRVIAYNKNGPSIPSEYGDTCMTEPLRPEQNPKNVKVEVIEPTKLSVSWTPIHEKDYNGPNTHYKVFWRNIYSESGWESKDVFGSTSSHCILENLPIASIYLVKVAAVNQLGIAGGYMWEVTVYCGKPLKAPTNFKMIGIQNSTCGLFRWDPPSTEDLEAELQGYKIQSWNAEDGEGSYQEMILHKNNTAVYLTRLSPYAENFVKLFAFNSTNEGPSVVISVDIADDYPSTVQNYEAYALGSSAILLTWDKPENPNGRITKYRVYTEKLGGSEAAEEKEVPLRNPLATSVKLNDLEPATLYRITVSASNGYGEGRGVFLTQQTGFKSKSHKPDKPNFSLQPLTSVKINWQPFNDKYHGTHFFAQYRKKGEPVWRETGEELHDDYLIIDKLEPNTSYQFRVVSVDGTFKTESEIQDFKTA